VQRRALELLGHERVLRATARRRRLVPAHGRPEDALVCVRRALSQPHLSAPALSVPGRHASAAQLHVRRKPLAVRAGAVRIDAPGLGRERRGGSAMR
jgi:hypothetical protein